MSVTEPEADTLHATSAISAGHLGADPGAIGKPIDSTPVSALIPESAPMVPAPRKEAGGDPKRHVFVAAALCCFISTLIMWACQVSVSWALVASVLSVILYVRLRTRRQRGDSMLGSCCASLWKVVAMLWLLAAFLWSMACLHRMGYLLNAPNPDDISDFIFALVTCGLLAVLLLPNAWLEHVWETDHSADSRGGSCGAAACCMLMPLGLLLTLAVVPAVVWAAHGQIMLLLQRPPDDFVETPEGRIHYWCLGQPVNGSIAIFEAGFMLPAVGLRWVQQGLSGLTRTCLLDRSGMGYSQFQADVGFRADARNMKAILDNEFQRLGVGNATHGRIAIVGGHSRGAATASRFKVDYNRSYDRVLVVSLDGSYCRQGPSEIDLFEHYMRMSESLAIYGVGAVGSLFFGWARIVWPAVKAFALSGGDALDPVDEGAPPQEIHYGDVPDGIGFLDRMLHANYWRSSAERSIAWRERFDSPSDGQCQRYVYESPDYLRIDSESICVDAARRPVPYRQVRMGNCTACACARHTSLVTASHFALQTAERVGDFVYRRLNTPV
eukprot:TRINITY_DN39953_c0_g1_i1.p1 TRINITY_DN39953_c0_g1~~TRINITY_DN39953_c0_g1_i1.p1  ORF type:complete len:554 (-),score=34.17 TRINITY_DN39953_c0_g1_i1:150-1811(-)